MKNDEQYKMLSSADTLAKCALLVENLEEASDALIELKKNHILLARDVALRVLREHIGDVYYQAHAFDVLYAVSLDDAIAYIESSAGTESSYVLGAMLDSVTEDSGRLEFRDEILKAVSLLRRAFALRSTEDLTTVSKQKAAFDEAYR